ncbi:MAG: 50S ribosomal protein L3 [Verrucomicrobia bacterium]|nr:50S ribosomal protein L3 [Verrucomicrobiota bacterium]
MKPKLMGIKQGMMQIFDDQGNRVVCTVILAEPHVISQIKTKENDGYTALQLASMKVRPSKAKNVKKPQAGHFKKAGIEPRKNACEIRVDALENYQLGQEMGVEVFNEIEFVDVRGISKGKGHQGVIKRHHFAGGPAAHGSGFHRHGGSCGMRTSPGRCLPGQKKSGRMGGEQVTMENLRVVKIDSEKHVILVEGAIPGSRGGLVYVTPAKKKVKKVKK